MINMFCSRTQHSDAGEARNSNAHVTRKLRIQLRVRCADPERGYQRALTPTLENPKPLGLFSNTGPDPMENQKLPSQHSILGNYRPVSDFVVELMMVGF